MISKDLYRNSLTNKFKELALHTIVNECFINALPFDTTKISNDDKRSLTKYSLKALESVGGFNLITNGAKSDNKLVRSIYTICTEAAKEAAARHVNEKYDNDKNGDFKEVVDNASFTKEEYNTFINKVDNLQPDEIANTVKEKTLAVIKSEKEAYEKEAQLEEELTAAIKDEEGNSMSVESYMDLVLDKSYTRSHVSLFSKLQESCMESLLTSEDEMDDNKIPFKALEASTFGNGFVFSTEEKDPITALEGLVLCRVPDEQERCQMPKLATICSIVIYTLLETLHTLNLFTPNTDTIKAFVNKPAYNAKTDGSVVQSAVDQALEKIKGMCTKGRTPAVELSQNLVTLEKIKENLSAVENVNGIDKEGTIKKIDEIKSTIVDTIENSRPARKEELSAFEANESTANVAEFNKIARRYRSNDNIKNIELIINSENPQGGYIDVACKDAYGHVVTESFIDFKYKDKYGKYMDYFTSVFEQSDLSSIAGKEVTYCDKTRRITHGILKNA